MSGHPFTEQEIARFWQRVEKGPGCWLWTGALWKGYGRFAPRKRVRAAAHRLSWCLANGMEIPAGLEVLHSCNNPRCVNPEHLRVGTHRENMADLKATGFFSALSRRRAERARRVGVPHDGIGTCPAGHPRNESNTYTSPSGEVNCRPCNNLATARYRERRRALQEA